MSTVTHHAVTCPSYLCQVGHVTSVGCDAKKNREFLKQMQTIIYTKTGICIFACVCQKEMDAFTLKRKDAVLMSVLAS